MIKNRGIVLSPDLGGKPVVFIHVDNPKLPTILVEKGNEANRVVFSARKMADIKLALDNRLEGTVITNEGETATFRIIGDRVKITKNKVNLFTWKVTDFENTLKVLNE